jgi:hypothetical protein
MNGVVGRPSCLLGHLVVVVQMAKIEGEVESGLESAESTSVRAS